MAHGAPVPAAVHDGFGEADDRSQVPDSRFGVEVGKARPGSWVLFHGSTMTRTCRYVS